MAKFNTKINLDGGLVYSTNPDFELPNNEEEEELAIVPPEKQLLKLQIRKLKGGKVATVILEFKGPEAEMEKLAKQLKKIMQAIYMQCMSTNVLILHKSSEPVKLVHQLILNLRVVQKVFMVSCYTLQDSFYCAMNMAEDKTPICYLV